MEDEELQTDVEEKEELQTDIEEKEELQADIEEDEELQAEFGNFVKSGEPEVSEEQIELEPGKPGNLGKPGKLGEPGNSMEPGEPGETEHFSQLRDLGESEENKIPSKHIKESTPLKSKEIDHPLIQFPA